MLSICKLCGQVKPLRDSHVLPEFVFRPAYDMTHTVVRVVINQARKFKQQKGFSERMLCEKCEGIFSRWENYFSRIWFNPRQRLRPLRLDDNIITIPGIDYSIFKLFHLSIIWRAGISSLVVFKNVDLGTQEKKIREHLLANNPGDPDEYTMVGIALREPDTKRFQDKILSAPEVARVHGHHIYSTIFGGVFWYYWISGHKEGRILFNCIEREGILTLAVQDWTRSRPIQELAKKIQKTMIK